LTAKFLCQIIDQFGFYCRELIETLSAPFWSSHPPRTKFRHLP
jgi:hypothetical protein